MTAPKPPPPERSQETLVKLCGEYLNRLIITGTACLVLLMATVAYCWQFFGENAEKMPVKHLGYVAGLGFLTILKFYFWGPKRKRK